MYLLDFEVHVTKNLDGTAPKKYLESLALDKLSSTIQIALPFFVALLIKEFRPFQLAFDYVINLVFKIRFPNEMHRLFCVTCQ